MGEVTAISWTDHTFNPWWGCARVSEGCTHCYAETFAVVRNSLPIWGFKRIDQDIDKHSRIVGGRRVWNHDSTHWQDPVKWNRAAEKLGERRRVFCASMADVFEEHPTLLPHREHLWRVIEVTPWLDWLLLTKRIENVMTMIPEHWRARLPWNVWIGTSVEDERVAHRIGTLTTIPAWIRWLSVEPLIGPLVLDPWLYPEAPCHPGIDWVIVGGESGPGFRPMNLDWARALREECEREDIPFFFKQVGGITPKAGGNELDGEVLEDWPRGREAPVPV